MKARTLLGLLLMTAAPGAEDAASWLRRAFEAEHQAAYTGIVTVTAYGQGTSAAATLRVTQSGGRRRVEVLAPPDSTREVSEEAGSLDWRGADSGGSVRCVDEPPAAAAQRLLRHYRATLERGSQTLVGRTARVLALSPLDAGKPPLKGPVKLWLDTATALILRSERLTADGRQRLAQRAFESVQFGAQPALPAPGRAPGESRGGNSTALPRKLPLGFELLPGEPACYSDGLLTLSLFVGDAGASAPLTAEPGQRLELWQRCQVLVDDRQLARHVAWLAGGRRYDLIAELEPAALRRVADSLLPGHGVRRAWGPRLGVLCLLGAGLLWLLSHALHRRRW